MQWGVVWERAELHAYLSGMEAITQGGGWLVKILRSQLQHGHACLCQRDQEGDGCWPETAAALVFLGQIPWQVGSKLAQPAQTCCPSSRFGGTRASSWGPLPCVELQVPDCLFQPLCSGSSIKHQLLLPACPLKTLPLPPASYQQSSCWFNLSEQFSPLEGVLLMGSLPTTSLLEG